MGTDPGGESMLFSYFDGTWSSCDWLLRCLGLHAVDFNVAMLYRMVEKNAAKRPSANEALSFPVINQKLEVQIFYAVMLMTWHALGSR